MPFRPMELATWVFLVAYVVLGVLPARGVVVCFEADGSASIELASTECTTCPELEAAPQSPSASGAEHERDLESCPCVDVPFALAGADLHSKPKLQAPSDAGSVALASAPLAGAFVALARPPSASLVRARPPRPPPSLASVRTIVLRV